MEIEPISLISLPHRRQILARWDVGECPEPTNDLGLLILDTAYYSLVMDHTSGNKQNLESNRQFDSFRWAYFRQLPGFGIAATSPR